MVLDLNAPISEVLLDSIPLPTQIFRIEDGLNVLTNRAAELLWGISRDVLVRRYKALSDPQAIALGVPAIFAQVAAGEVVRQEPILYDASQLEGGQDTGRRTWVMLTYFPIRDGQGTVTHLGAIYRDVTDEVAQQEAIAAAQHEIESQRELIASLEAAQREIESQRSVIQELSSPITRVWDGVLVVPLVGGLDALRATTVTESLLEAIVAQQASIVILDITGVPLVDTQVASYLVKATSACKLLGSTVVLVGIGSEIAQAIVHLGVDLSGIVTRSNLQAGILWAFERLGLQVVPRPTPGGAR